MPVKAADSREVLTMQKILVVDDEARMRKLVHDFLIRAGYEVLEAGDGLEAVDIFEQQPDIALIILDVMMPGLDGYGVTRQIRKTSKVPIIMLTAKSEEQDELLGFDLGVDDYVRKPFSPKILVARVEALLERGGCGKNDERLQNSGSRSSFLPKSLSCSPIFLKTADGPFPVNRFSIMSGIMIITEMPEPLTRMLRSCGARWERRAI